MPPTLVKGWEAPASRSCQLDAHRNPTASTMGGSHYLRKAHHYYTTEERGWCFVNIFGTSIDLQTTRVCLRELPSCSIKLEFSVTLSCALPAQMLLSRLLVAVSQVSGGGFVESEASVFLMIVFVERMCAQLSNVES